MEAVSTPSLEQTTGQDTKLHPPVLLSEAEALEASFQSVLKSVAQLVRFQADLQRLNVQGFVPTAPASLANALRDACKDYDKAADSIEAAVRYAIAVIERDIRRATGQPHPAAPVSINVLPAEDKQTPADPAASSADILPYTTDVVDLVTPTGEDAEPVPNRTPAEREPSAAVVEIPDDEPVAPADAKADATPTLEPPKPSPGASTKAASPLPARTESTDAMALDDDAFGGSLFGSNANSDVGGSVAPSPAEARRSFSGAPPSSIQPDPLAVAALESSDSKLDPNLDLLNQLVAATSGVDTSAGPSASQMVLPASSAAIDFSSLITGLPPPTDPPAPSGNDTDTQLLDETPSADLLAIFESLQPEASDLGGGASASGSSNSAADASMDLSNPASLFSSAFSGNSTVTSSSGGPALDLAALASSGIGFPAIPSTTTTFPTISTGEQANANGADSDSLAAELESFFNSWTNTADT